MTLGNASPRRLKEVMAEFLTKLSEGTDAGHTALLSDITSLFEEIVTGEFHDFLTEKYAAPKQKLAEILNEIRNNVINGKYDN